MCALCLRSVVTLSRRWRSVDCTVSHCCSCFWGLLFRFRRTFAPPSLPFAQQHSTTSHRRDPPPSLSTPRFVVFSTVSSARSVPPHSSASTSSRRPASCWPRCPPPRTVREWRVTLSDQRGRVLTYHPSPTTTSASPSPSRHQSAARIYQHCEDGLPLRLPIVAGGPALFRAGEASSPIVRDRRLVPRPSRSLVRSFAPSLARSIHWTSTLPAVAAALLSSLLKGR